MYVVKNNIEIIDPNGGLTVGTDYPASVTFGLRVSVETQSNADNWEPCSHEIWYVEGLLTVQQVDNSTSPCRTRTILETDTMT